MAIGRYFCPRTSALSPRPSFPSSCQRYRPNTTTYRLVSTNSQSPEERLHQDALEKTKNIEKESLTNPLPTPNDVLPLLPPDTHLKQERFPSSLSQPERDTPVCSIPGSSLNSEPQPQPTSSTYTVPSSLTIPPKVQERLTEWSTAVLIHSKQIVQEAQSKFLGLGLKLNEMTGYLEVERLKHLVFEKEDELQKLRENVRAAKVAYDEAITARSDAQRDLNTLLERKHSWTDSDVSRFTTLVRSDHSASHAVATTSMSLKEAELAVDKAFSQLMQVILQRYHEEQVWSDKIRSVSTWANVAGLALNLIVFIGAILVVEPWKRKRLVEKLEERVSGMMERVDQRLGGVEGHLKNVVAGVAAKTGTAEVIEVVDLDLDKSNMEFAKSRPELVSPSLASVLPDAELRPPLPSTHLYFDRAIDGLPSYFRPITEPSQERDLALVGIAGAVIAWTLTGLFRLLFS
ncbi:hypothetical protein L204_102121 [Cryptococcus depauperatus]|nr:hypothetical protein L204_04608 [Cryptococcus depauperatus CBS 7855]